MEQKKDYVIVNIPTNYTYSPSYSVTPSPIIYSMSPSPTSDSSRSSSPTNPSPILYNQFMPTSPSDIPNFIKPNYSNLTNLTHRRKLNSKHISNHSIYEQKDLIVIHKNIEKSVDKNIEKNVEINDKKNANVFQEENNENYSYFKNEYKLSNYTKSFKNFIGKQQIINNDNQEYV
jgi:hypothetical protein